MSTDLLMCQPHLVEQDLLSCILCKGIVEAPLLLHCLHSCCWRCAIGLAENNGSDSLRCPACDVITDIGTQKQHNLFIADQVRLFKLLTNATNCSFCREEDESIEKQANVWCLQCQRSLCSECIPGHAKYNKSHKSIDIAKITNQSQECLLSSKPCALHAKQLELMCFDCKQAKCIECVTQCETAGHSLLMLKGPKVTSVLSDARKRVQQWRDLLESKSARLQQHKSLINDINLARSLDLDRLRTKKKCTLDAVTKAYDDGESELQAYYDRLEAAAASLRTTRDHLEQTSLQALKYANNLVESADVVGLLGQHTTLLSRLKTLIKELDDTRAIRDVAELNVLDCSLPENLHKVLASWVRSSKFPTEDNNRSIEDVLISEQQVDMDDFAGMSSFKLGRSTFSAPVKCNDVAVTDSGHLLLAAGEHGLKECEVSGRELRAWKPPNKSDGGADEVVSVQTLENGRAAVGVLHSKLIVLIRGSADGGEWLEEKSVDVSLKSPLWLLSVRGDLVAVAERSGDRCWAGRQLVLARLDSGRVLQRQEREYDIQTLTVTALAVVTVSQGKIETKGKILTDAYGRQHRVNGGFYIIDSYSHQGERLWRHESSDELRSVFSAPCGVLYLVGLCTSPYPSGAEVMALSEEGGRKLSGKTVTSENRMEIMPAVRGQRKSLAVLGRDFTTVLVYTCAGSSK